MVQVLINGIAQGSLYGLVAVSIVLVLRVSGLANFCQGQLGMVGAFAGYFFALHFGLPGWVAAATAVLAGCGFALLVFLVTLYRQTSTINGAIRTMGIDTMILALGATLWGVNEPYKYPEVIPFRNVALGPVEISSLHIVVIAFTTVLIIALHLLFNRTVLGFQMRAIADNQVWAQLVGINPTAVWIGTWALSGGLTAATAVLYAPWTFLATSMMVPFLLKSFAAVVLGGVDNWHGVLLGGIILGVVESFAGSYVSYLLSPALAFTVLALVLAFKPEGIFSRGIAVRV